VLGDREPSSGRNQRRAVTMHSEEAGGHPCPRPNADELEICAVAFGQPALLACLFAASRTQAARRGQAVP
jgi:hypothetical protein